MTPTELLIFAAAGLFAGILAGFLGIGGGTVLVPFLMALGYEYPQAVAISLLAIVITASSGSWQNWRMGLFSFERVIGIGIPALVAAPIGAYLTGVFPQHWLEVAFGIMLLFSIYLLQLRIQLRKTITAKYKPESPSVQASKRLPQHLVLQTLMARIATGIAAGMLAGFFGVGGGAVMVPLQILLLGETIKTAIQTSLGVIVITAISACVGHALQGNLLWAQGLMLGVGGSLGALISTRFLPKLPERVVSLAFCTLLVMLSISVFWQAWQDYRGYTVLL
ncbi:MAG: sulfite exporter TauE/SafE family protein [Symploca sp. SIO3C6]|uniref:Probable membrane transporter protein n=1 Tax=Symploca sp. SIO1C4 TaxID=2607765 RepID=A0A6B3NB97_9CYAN|nr:sulfite exporter TauE/SafE family protein [Symploca sp. SIO3C6]NER28205.1 sulfite exporter TauE/SafE family protein [Symploca sp. SIO1C4]